MQNITRPLSRREASEYLLERYGIRRSPTTLAKYAVIGGGPIYRKANRAVLYDPGELDSWASEIVSPPRRSTSEIIELA